MGGRVRLLNDVEILQAMIISGARVPLQQGQGKPSVKLTDRQAGTTVEIKGLPHDSIVIRAEVFVPRADINGSQGKSIFEGSKGENKRADFVIVSNKDTSKWIICIEMQAGNSKTAKCVVKQLKGAQCFMRYCKCIGKEFWLEKEFLDDYEYRFISMANIHINKRPTRHTASGSLHNCPENFLKISRGISHHFNRLVHKAS